MTKTTRPSYESTVEADVYSSSDEELGSLHIPKRRSSLHNARSGNHSVFDFSDLRSSIEACIPGVRPSSVRSGTSKSQDSEKHLNRSTPGTGRLHESPSEEIFSPVPLSLAADTPATDLSRITPRFAQRFRTSLTTTPTRRSRAVSSGAVVDTPPRSTDRFIPCRSRGDNSISNYRASKLLSELSAEQKQMILDGAVPDPFMARRVTPQFSIRRTTSVGRNPQIRAASAGGVWNVGGSMSQSNITINVQTGRAPLLESGTNARVFSSDFFNLESPQETHERFEGRLAMALDLDPSGKVFDMAFTGEVKRSATIPRVTTWKDGQWTPHKWTKVLDAPSLKNDFYCSLLAYCPVSRMMAVGLRNRVYIWSETQGVENQPRADPEGLRCSVTSLSFSSPGAGKSILAIGRNDGRVNLWCIKEKFDRIEHTLPTQVCSLAWKPVKTRRFSVRTRSVVSEEDLLVGCDSGKVYYYTVEWPELGDTSQPTSMTLLAILDIHNHQVCGLAWSPDGEYFATGGNDNICYLFAAKDALSGVPRKSRYSRVPEFSGMSPHAPEFIPNQTMHYTMGVQCSVCNTQSGVTNRTALGTDRPSAFDGVVTHGPAQARHRWVHAAAVKAIAFCPWQRGLIATGGGCNDRAIHFFHTTSGACLATINVYAQVTSLIWSKTKREICATLGYASPDHPYRIVVFSWPDCRQIVRIPWKDNMRALYAIAYPRGPNDDIKSSKGNTNGKRGKDSEGGVWWSRTKEEGCIVVASSDQSVRFYEVWSGHSSMIGPKTGGLAWSSILESEEGGDVEFGEMEVIR